MNLLPKLVEVRGNTNTGLKPDLHAMLNFIWEDGRNVRFTKGGVAKMLGWTSQTSQLESATHSTLPRGGVAHIDGPTEEFHFGNTTRIFHWDGATLTIDATVFANSGALWSFANWGAWVVATDGVHVPVIYKGASYATLAGTPPTTAEIFVVIQNQMVAFNTDLDTKGYEFSDIDDVEDWAPVATNAAGSNTVREFTAPIVAAVPLGDSIAMYAGQKMAILSPLGAPLYFGHKVVFEKGISVYNKRSVVPVGDLNIGLGPNGFFLTDGVSITTLGEGEVADTWRRDVNDSFYSEINAYHNALTKEVVWYYPSGINTVCDKAIAYNYETNTMTFHDHGRSTAISAETSSSISLFAKPLTVEPTYDGVIAWQIYQHNDGTDDDTIAMVSYIESKPYAIQDAEGKSYEDFIKYVEAIKLYMGIFISTAIRIQIGVKDSLDDDTYFVDVVQLDDPTTPIYPEISGRWIVLRIESAELGDEWELQGFAIHGTLTGGNPQ